VFANRKLHGSEQAVLFVVQTPDKASRNEGIACDVNLSYGPQIHGWSARRPVANQMLARPPKHARLSHSTRLLPATAHEDAALADGAKSFLYRAANS
jgi:hypothetical protein